MNHMVGIYRTGSYGGCYFDKNICPIPAHANSLSPNFFVTPILFFLISRKYVWLSIPLTVLVELLVNWRNFTYYESRGLMILVTLFQLAIMAVVIILLRSAFTKKKT